MAAELDRLVRQRADSRCEYCRIHEDMVEHRHEIDHVIARQHGGQSVAENLTLACVFCNRHKGPNLAGIDPETGRMIRLFHPRKDRWARHFAWEGPTLTGRTTIGRTTVRTLAINRFELVQLRQALIAEGVFPPD